MYHQITIVGNLGKDAEMRFTPSGSQVISLSVASANPYFSKENDEWVNPTVWFRIAFWGKMADSTYQKLVKGAPVFVVGALKADPSGNPRMFKRKDGTMGTSFELTAQKIRVFAKSGGQYQEPSTEEEKEDKDIPF